MLELSEVFRLGTEITEVLLTRGGVIALDSFLGAYKSLTAKNLDPTVFGYNSIESLLSSYHSIVTLRNRTIVIKVLE